jgi:hypothetical protein
MASVLRILMPSMRGALVLMDGLAIYAIFKERMSRFVTWNVKMAVLVALESRDIRTHTTVLHYQFMR